MEVVLDANVLVSGFTFAGGVPDQLLRRWQDGSYQIIVSPHLIAELSRTLEKPYFRARLSESEIQRLLVLLRSDARSTETSALVAGVASHPEDDLILATALSGAADFLVTGDRQLQRLGAYEGVVIRSPRDFLALLEWLNGDDEIVP